MSSDNLSNDSKLAPVDPWATDAAQAIPAQDNYPAKHRMVFPLTKDEILEADEVTGGE